MPRNAHLGRIGFKILPLSTKPLSINRLKTSSTIEPETSMDRHRLKTKKVLRFLNKY